MSGHRWRPVPWTHGSNACANCGTPMSPINLAASCPGPMDSGAPALAEIAASLRRIEAMITELAAVMLAK